jgi:hypothetical protein
LRCTHRAEFLVGKLEKFTYKNGTLRKIKGLGEKAYGELYEWIEVNKLKTK